MGLVPISKICSTEQTCCITVAWHLRHSVPTLIPYYAKPSHCLMLTWGCTATLPHYDAMSLCGNTALWCDFLVRTWNIFLDTGLQNFNLRKMFSLEKHIGSRKEETFNFSFSLASTFPILLFLLDDPYNDETTVVVDFALWWTNRQVRVRITDTSCEAMVGINPVLSLFHAITLSKEFQAVVYSA